MQGLEQVLGSSSVDLGSLGEGFGLNPEQTRSATGSPMPAIIGGFHRQVGTGDPRGVVDTAHSVGEADAQTGNDILEHMLGGKDVSRQIADHAAEQSGFSSNVPRAMPPVVAAIVARHVAAGRGGGAGAGGLGGMLASVRGDSGNSGAMQGSPGLGGRFGGGANPLGEVLGELRR